MTQRRIRLAEYSLCHHSTSLLRVSRPTAPPSPSSSLKLEEDVDGAGDAAREAKGVAARLLELDPLVDVFPLLSDFKRPLALRSRAALERLSMLPLPNLLQGCPGFVRCLLSWNMRQMSDWRFFLCSEFTAFSSRDVHDGANRGQWKKAANRASAPGRAEVETLKK